ncbi:hypothetical protein [Microcystis phage Mae-JY02]
MDQLIDRAGSVFAKKLVDRVAVIATIALALSWVLGWWQPYDDTDNPPARSGMIIRTDCLTGRQYLADGKGGLTPRIGSDGQQIIRQCEARDD